MNIGTPAVSCVFCSVVSTVEPASRVFEDDDVVAFMDIRPVRPGQTLIVPKEHIDHFSDLPDRLGARVFQLGQQLARAMRRTLNPKRVGMVVHGFGVPHAHLVVLPLEHAWDITASQYSSIENGRVIFRWEQVPIAPRSDLDELAHVLRAALVNSKR